MKLTITRPLAGIDIESTGTDVAKDHIVTLGIIKIIPTQPSLDPIEKRVELKFNPGFDMSDEVVAIHGITNEMARSYPPMSKQHALDIVSILSGCDLCGFNSNNFDIPMLWEELARQGVEWDLTGVNMIDVGNIFKLREERTLSAAVKFYCGRDHMSAHTAVGDVAETLAVLDGQLAKYSDLAGMDAAALAKYSAMDDRIDLAGIIVRNKDGEPVFNTKRNRGVLVRHDIGYAEWFLRSDFTQNTKAVIRRLLEEIQQKEELFK